MENCLITTLKGSVDNNNLPYYGEIKFKYFKESGVWVSASTEISAKDLSGNFVSPAGVSEVKGTSITFTPGVNHTVLIRSKYDIGAIQGIYTSNMLDIEELNYMINLNNAYIRVKGDLDDLKENIKMTTFRTIPPGLTGDVSNFAKFPNITTLSFIGCSDIFGTLESLFAAFPASKTGTITINANDCPNVTYNGVAAGNASYTKNGNTWEKDA